MCVMKDRIVSPDLQLNTKHFLSLKQGCSTKICTSTHQNTKKDRKRKKKYKTTMIIFAIFLLVTNGDRSVGDSQRRA